MGRFFRVWNSSILAHPVIRRLMRFAVLKHTGRRSGRVYATPVSARPTAPGFVYRRLCIIGSSWFLVSR
jgi:hypothetical protein